MSIGGEGARGIFPCRTISDSQSSSVPEMAAPRKQYIHTFATISIGSDLGESDDIIFAIGAAVIAITGGPVERVESRRWVFRFASGGKSPAEWEALWRERNYDAIAWNMKWANHVDALNGLLASETDTFASQKDMIDSFAAYVAESTRMYQPRHLIRLSFCNLMLLNKLLERYGHSPLFVRPPPHDITPSENVFSECQDISCVPADARDLKDPRSIALQVAYMSVLWT